jgi:hypothetical protein
VRADPGRRIPAFCLVVTFGIGVSGCYDFPVALDPAPVVPLDPNLLGLWACLPAKPRADVNDRLSDDARLMTLRFTASGKEYAIEMTGLDKPGEKTSMRGFPSRIEGRTILNVQTDPGSEKPYTLVSVRLLTPSVSTFDLVEDEPLKGKPMATSSELRKAIAEFKPQSALFSSFLVCARATRESPEPTASPTPRSGSDRS